MAAHQPRPAHQITGVAEGQGDRPADAGIAVQQSTTALHDGVHLLWQPIEAEQFLASGAGEGVGLLGEMVEVVFAELGKGRKSAQDSLERVDGAHKG